MSKWDKFLSREIEIEFKAALYFYTILFFYFACQLFSGSMTADIIIIIEMIVTAYVMGFVQVYMLGNFDEAEQFTRKEALKIVGCSAAYSIVSYLGGWFERDLLITAIYFVFMFAAYGSAYWLYSVRRAVNTREMNRELEAFKQKIKMQNPVTDKKAAR